MGEKVILELDMEHAKAPGSMLDLAGRIHIGQLEEIALLTRDGRIQAKASDNSNRGRPLNGDEQGRLLETLNTAKRILGHSGGSFGIGGRGVHDEARLGYEIMKAVKKAVHDRLHPDVRHHVDADGVTVRYAHGPAPVARIEEAS